MTLTFLSAMLQFRYSLKISENVNGFFYILKGYKNVTLRTNGLGLRHKLISLRFTMFYSYFNPLIVKVAII